MPVSFELEPGSAVPAEVAETIARMPDVSTHFDPASVAADAGAAEAPQVGAELDSNGAAWDAAIHSASKAKTANGAWRRKRQSRAVSGVAPVDPNVPTPPTADQIARARACGRMIATNEILLCQGLFGHDEWTPTDDEKVQLMTAWEECAIALGWWKSHPLVAPVVATVIYAGARVMQKDKYPQTATRMGRVYMWFRDKRAAWQERRAAKARAANPNAPRPVPDLAAEPR